MKKIIGITGPIASGKDKVGTYLSSKTKTGVYHISQILRDIALKQTGDISRKYLVALGKKIAEDEGRDFLAKQVYKKIESTGIVTGIRQVEQIRYFEENSDFILISVDAKPEIRFKRAKERGKISEAKSLKDFVANEIAENSGDQPQRLFDCMKLAQYHILNNGTIDDLKKKVNRIIVEESL